ncbi:MerR family transcriptional regulator [Lysinibacillus xylanilyticus]|uniref:MerR family transcriptional regulator n=1 Tax=Lysinibacillus xylanilyticus TaxID=582475 RepID=UPI002B245D24|nr:MerR family transcriptional regulator [Lysinibacillus xylanilyticus]MEB2300781.1 MerR family transcriptional regulator [Lysinibacillus xylanilyticus]
MYSIGQFSKKTGVSIRTLRYYDEMNLLKPSYISETGRRFYENEDIITLQKITGLKTLGFSLKDIQEVMGQSQWDITESLKYQKGEMLLKLVEIKKNIELLEYTISLAQSNQVIEPEIFIALIQNNLHMESQQRWLKDHLPNEVVDEIYAVSNGQNVRYDTQLIKVINQLKIAYKNQFTDTEVHTILKELFSQIPHELFNRLLTEPKLMEIQLDSMLFSSPFSKQEEEWLIEKIGSMLKEYKTK